MALAQIVDERRAPAAVPPRKVVPGRNQSQTIIRNTDSREVLMGMGFPKNRAEKALAATADSGVQVAADWLLTHAFDPDLDKNSPREFIVYACPLGTFGNQLEEYMEQTLYRCGRNGAHKSDPHVTLCQYFLCDDSLAASMIHCLKTCIENLLPKAPKDIRLKRYVAQGYIGLFLEEEEASWLREVMKIFTSEAKKIGVNVDPHRRQLHLTLSHQYTPEHHGTLEELARSKIDPQAPAKWELRLYSRDPRQGSSELYKVLFPYTPTKDDELVLTDGDYVYVHASDSGHTENEGWFFGTSHNSGCSGLYPGNYVEKVKDAACWMLHRSWLVSGSDSLPAIAKSIRPPSTLRRERREDEPLYDSAAGLLPQQNNVEELYAKVQKPRDRKKAAANKEAAAGKDMMMNGSNHTVEDSSPPPLPIAGPRRLFILRHAERVDVTFGKQWIQLSFDPDGYYHRRNLNMPKEVPQRKGGPNDFLKDAPVTEVGLFQARLTGEGMRDQGIRISHVFSSPALRCIQTAHAILQGLGEPGVKIRIENGLFEWLAWCQGVFPTFMSPNYLMKNGFQVDPSYLSQVTLNDLKPKETHLEFYKRMYATHSQDARAEQWQRDVCGSRGDAGDVHATAGRAQPHSAQELTKMVQKIPYLGMCVAQESEYGRTAHGTLLICPSLHSHMPPTSVSIGGASNDPCFLEFITFSYYYLSHLLIIIFFAIYNKYSLLPLHNNLATSAISLFSSFALFRAVIAVRLIHVSVP